MSARVRKTADLGQSLWYDNIGRAMFASGALHDLITRDGIVGVTSNPAIFERAIAGGDDYTGAMQSLVDRRVGDAHVIYEALAIDDIRSAADALQDTHVATGGRDGYVSFEVSPYLAHRTDETVAGAIRAAVGKLGENMSLADAVCLGNPEGLVGAYPRPSHLIPRRLGSHYQINVVQPLLELLGEFLQSLSHEPFELFPSHPTLSGCGSGQS